jgi:predicted adenylyl cyclase CyaB
VGRTRVHLDRVEGLGDFVELEIVLQEADDSETAFSEARTLMERLGIEPSELIETAYVDRLAQRFV